MFVGGRKGVRYRTKCERDWEKPLGTRSRSRSSREVQGVYFSIEIKVEILSPCCPSSKFWKREHKRSKENLGIKIKVEVEVKKKQITIFHQLT